MDLNHVRQLMRSLYWSTEREINHIATVEPSAPGVDYSVLIMETAMAVKMAVETAVEMTPGAIPRPGGVPEQRRNRLL